MEKKRRRRKCQCCGELKYDVKTDIDPYQEDVNNIKVKVAMCRECYNNACMDI